ncbi:flagellar hook protein FlgE [Anaerocolumna aminovalerica]|uniref:Flagellar hook protein FlgE n=1 Tax=Anaerocolumna aminovalerica TaxID=1527 RepID=A0A1I5I6H7_9FIRM|nr:flagellar hook protein FlgE [Anaerocolumna aminovalerica]SFO55671.1 flagellar hook protein FlgE [Anaerocolumna aminovalerica]
MMRSLYSGVSGLRVHQTKMDVIGNNIANVNTIGFKSSKVNFSDIFYQTTQSATGPNGETGAAGQNAMQIGLGSTVASIKASITQHGGAQRTDDPYDIMISGDSFFIVNSGGTNYFTKAGAFDIDGAGTLCTPSGAKVMGWQVDPKDEKRILAGTVSELNIMSPENQYSKPEATTAARIFGNIDSQDPQVASTGSGKNVTVEFFDSLGHTYKANYNIKQSSATDTNKYTVTLTDITDDKGKSIFATYNETTKKYEAKTGVSATFGTGSGTVAVDPDTGKVTLTGATSSLEFNGVTGKFESVGGTAGNKTVTLKATTSPDPFKNVVIDFSTITMFSESGSSSLESAKGDLNNLGAGKKVGNMNGISIDTSGKIYGKYDNGDSRLLGQIAVASFANPAGLEAIGDNMFAQTLNSGEFDGIGHDVSRGGGKFTTGVLEMSNVDLSQEFTDMITTQRGFQANSRIITTSDSLLEELVNLKR